VKCSELHKGRDFEEVRVYEVCVWYEYSENVTMSRYCLFLVPILLLLSLLMGYLYCMQHQVF
jgi:hypothetical protein